MANSSLLIGILGSGLYRRQPVKLDYLSGGSRMFFAISFRKPAKFSSCQPAAGIETGLRASADRAQPALKEAHAALQKMLDAINEGRAARGLASLDVTLAPLQRS